MRQVAGGEVRLVGVVLTLLRVSGGGYRLNHYLQARVSFEESIVFPVTSGKEVTSS